MGSDERALERLRMWGEKRAPLSFSYTGPPHNFSIEVEVRGVGDDSVSFQWLLHATDGSGAFITTEGFFVVWLKGATLSTSEDSKPSVTLSRDPFRVDLREIRASAFG